MESQLSCGFNEWVMVTFLLYKQARLAVCITQKAKENVYKDRRKSDFSFLMKKIPCLVYCQSLLSTPCPQEAQRKPEDFQTSDSSSRIDLLCISFLSAPDLH